MSTAIQLVAVVTVIITTYIFFQGFGSRNNSLLYSKSEKINWNSHLKERLGSWLVVTSVFGTLTSFPTILFLIGSVKLFGPFSFATGVTIVLGALVTNKLTRPIQGDARVNKLLTENEQVSGVIANLFWGNNTEQKALSYALKYVSLISILALIWLDFTALIDLTVLLHGIQSIIARSAMMGCAVFVVIYFVLRFGIRGFVFADLLHAPLIGIAAVTLLAAAIGMSWGTGVSTKLPELLAPLLQDRPLGIPYAQGIWFLLHVLVLNTLQVVCSEPHWFRLWLLGEKELKRQLPGAGITGATWIAMVPIGFLIFWSTHKVAEPAIVDFITALDSVSPLLVGMFWIGATAALFASADIQAYSFFLVGQFNPQTGLILDVPMTRQRSLLNAVSVAISFAVLYGIVRAYSIPIEKVIFVIVPFVVTVSPAFIHYWLGRQPQSWVILTSVVGYIVIAGIGFWLPNTNFYATLGAIFVPVFVAFITAPFVPASRG